MVDLKELERRAFRSTFQDGLWDIYLGVLLLQMGLAPLVAQLGLRNHVWILVIDVVLIGLALGGFWTAKKLITIPRIGRVRFGPDGKSRRNKTSLVLFLSVIVGLALFLVVWASRSGLVGWAPLELLIPGAWVMNVLVVFAASAYILSFERLYLYAVLYAVPVPLWMTSHRWTEVELGVPAFAVPAGIMIVIGVITLVRFLRDYPLPEETSHATEH